jgi:quercetin dioxygenase-like cupin family protein
MGVASGITRRTLPLVEPPIPVGGGRIHTEAGELAEIVNGREFRSLVYVEFLPGASRPRGDHFHRIKTERLYVISGSLHATFRHIESGDSQKLELGPGDLVSIPPGWAHVFVADNHAHAVEFSEHPYTPTDTFPYEVCAGE